MGVIFTAQDPPSIAFSPKRLAERISYGIDFVNLLNSGESISSTNWYITTIRPIDAPAPIAMIFGSPNINNTQVFQQIQGGVEGVLYNVVAQISTNLSNIIEQHALLLTTDSAFEGE